ncbi:MAG: phosphatase PAP2 family protein, partial [Firmicutes bacterium]|nr:phosphatase PAP2 family protein [Bacillota bacterium]
SSALTVSLAGSKPGLGVVLLIVTLLLMVSRVYVGTHYPVDVIGGALTGILGSAVTNLLWPYLDKFGDKLINLYERFTPI